MGNFQSGHVPQLLYFLTLRTFVIEMSDSETINTADLYLAAALITSGHRPQELIPDDRRTLFSFDLSGDLRSLIQKYYRGSLAVDALSYAEALRSTKAAAINVAGRAAR